MPNRGANTKRRCCSTATGTGAGTLSAPDANGYYTITLTGVNVVAGASMLTGGVETGWTFCPPYSTGASDSNVFLTGIGVFVTGFSSILTGLNFMVTIHRMRAPGLTWFRMPLFVWANYATSIVMMENTRPA